MAISNLLGDLAQQIPELAKGRLLDEPAYSAHFQQEPLLHRLIQLIDQIPGVGFRIGFDRGVDRLRGWIDIQRRGGLEGPEQAPGSLTQRDLDRQVRLRVALGGTPHRRSQHNWLERDLPLVLPVEDHRHRTIGDSDVLAANVVGGLDHARHRGLGLLVGRKVHGLLRVRFLRRHQEIEPGRLTLLRG